jgi:hypothetical protein
VREGEGSDALRCHLLDCRNEIAAIEVIHCGYDREARQRTDDLLAQRPEFRGVEVWELDRRSTSTWWESRPRSSPGGRGAFTIERQNLIAPLMEPLAATSRLVLCGLARQLVHPLQLTEVSIR